MNYKKSYIILSYSLLIFISSCNSSHKEKDPQHEVANEQNIKEAIIENKPISEIDSIRALVHTTYQIAKQKDDTPKPIARATNAAGCIPCDMAYLSYLNEKDDYTMEDVKQLLCLDNQDKCTENAEFSQFYNEMIFKVFQRERYEFTDAQIITLLKDEELMEELLNPTLDTSDINLLTALKLDAKNPND